MFQISEQPNQALETGTWTSFRGAEFLIAHAGSLKFQRAMMRLQKPFRRKMERGEMDPADQKRILIQALAESILLDWKGVKDSDGKEVSYSRDLGVKAITNDESFREFIMEFSMDMQNFIEEAAEHEGNS